MCHLCHGERKPNTSEIALHRRQGENCLWRAGNFGADGLLAWTGFKEGPIFSPVSDLYFYLRLRGSGSAQLIITETLQSTALLFSSLRFPLNLTACARVWRDAAVSRRHRPSVGIYYSCKKTREGKMGQSGEAWGCVRGERERQIYNIDWQIKCHCQRPRRSIPISHGYKTQRLVRPRLWCRRFQKHNSNARLSPPVENPDEVEARTAFFFFLLWSPFIWVKSHSISPPRSNEAVWHLERCRRAACLYRSPVERHANSWSLPPWAAVKVCCATDVYG